MSPRKRRLAPRADATARPPAREDRRKQKRPPQILIITGLSGSGKTHVARALEDVGWFCVDNLPSALIPTFADLVAGHLAAHAGSESRRAGLEGSRHSVAPPPSPQTELQRSALVVDIREPEFLKQFPRVLRHLRAKGVAVSLLFLEADEKVLARRYNETRRPHPLAINQPAIEGIREEREALKPIRKVADLVLDTSDYTVHQLRDYIREHYDVRHQAPPIVLSVMSFGYKFGVPSEADLVFDCRFLPNPNFVPSLKALTGNHAPVIRYMKRQPDTEVFLRKLRSFIGYVLPRYVKEGKSYLTVAVGCTGGRHRSVMIANSLGQWLEGQGYPVKVRHRDLRQEQVG